MVRRRRVVANWDLENDVGETTSSEKAFGAEGLSRKGASTPTRAAKRNTSARAAASPTRIRKPVPKPSRVATAAALLRGAAEGAAAAVARRLPWAKDQNDPIVLLEADHRRFEKLLEQGEARPNAGQSAGVSC